MERQASEAVPVCRARIVKHIEAGRLLGEEFVQLLAENWGPYVYPLSSVGFLPGDLVEIRLIERPRPAR